MPAVRITPLPTDGAGFGYRIETPGATDYLFVSNSWSARDIVLDEIHTNAPLLHLRFESGRPVQGCACEGTYLAIGKTQVFHAPGTMLAREFRCDGRAGLVVHAEWNPRR